MTLLKPNDYRFMSHIRETGAFICDISFLIFGRIYLNTLHLPYHCNTTRASHFVVTATYDTFILEPHILLPAQLRPSTRKNL